MIELILSTVNNSGGQLRSLSFKIDSVDSGTEYPALTITVNASGDIFLSAAASSGRVDQTIVDASSLNGRKASGPVGKNRWKAVLFG